MNSELRLLQIQARSQRRLFLNSMKLLKFAKSRHQSSQTSNSRTKLELLQLKFLLTSKQLSMSAACSHLEKKKQDFRNSSARSIGSWFHNFHSTNRDAFSQCLKLWQRQMLQRQERRKLLLKPKFYATGLTLQDRQALCSIFLDH